MRKAAIWVNKIPIFDVRMHNMMKTDGTWSLAKGQIWKTSAADIEIMGLGKRFIHYKVATQFGVRRQVSAQVSGIEAMAKYLQANEAKLVQGPSNN